MQKIIKIVVISIILSVAVLPKINKNTLFTSVCGFSFLEVSSGSMVPTFSIGDIIIIKKCEDYEVGDIVTYNVDNCYLVTHRIIERNGNNFVTKGDSNNKVDTEIVTKENIEGKFIYKTKLLKWIYNHWILVFIIVALILILW